MPGPGWYPDPQDAASVRWFDGDNWSEHRQPLEADGAIDTVDTVDTVVTSNGASATGLIPTGYDPYVASAAYGATPDVDFATATAAFAAGGSVSTDQRPNQDSDPAASGGGATGPAHGHASGRRASLDRRSIVILATILVVVAGLITGGILLLTGGGSSFTYQGKSIHNADKTLTQAQTELSGLVTQRHGVSSFSSTRCYYSQPTKPASGHKSDIEAQLRCGPVLFVDGDPDKEYLTFGFSSTPTGSGVTLTPAAAPDAAAPAAIPSDVALKRPDGKKPPAGDGGLQPPAPLAAPADVLTAAVVAVPSGTTPITATLGSYTGGITITDIGKVSRYGQGDSARSAPANQHLYAFKLAAATGNNGAVNDLSAMTTVSIDGLATRGLPAAAAGDEIVVAVPDSAKNADLVLTESDLKQSFSLLTGKPAAGNVEVLARTHRSTTVGQSVTATYNYSTKVVFADKATGQTQTATITLASATLAYRDDANNYTVSGGPSAALLIPDIVYTGSHDGGPFGVDTSLLTFTPTGGTAIPAKNISADPSKIRNVFEVAAGVTTGTITVGGTATETFSGSTSTYTVTVAAPMSIPVSFPAG